MITNLRGVELNSIAAMQDVLLSSTPLRGGGEHDERRGVWEGRRRDGEEEMG